MTRRISAEVRGPNNRAALWARRGTAHDPQPGRIGTCGRDPPVEVRPV
jgi:hypothetical protein